MCEHGICVGDGRPAVGGVFRRAGSSCKAKAEKRLFGASVEAKKAGMSCNNPGWATCQSFGIEIGEISS